MDHLPDELILNIIYNINTLDTLINFCNSTSRFRNISNDKLFLKNYFARNFSLNSKIFNINSIRTLENFRYLQQAINKRKKDMFYDDDYHTLKIYQTFMSIKLADDLVSNGYINALIVNGQSIHIIDMDMESNSSIMGIFMLPINKSLEFLESLEYLNLYFLPLKFSIYNLTIYLGQFIDIPKYIKYTIDYLRGVNTDMFNYLPVNFRYPMLLMVINGITPKIAIDRLKILYPMIYKIFDMDIDYSYKPELKRYALNKLDEFYQTLQQNNFEE